MSKSWTFGLFLSAVLSITSSIQAAPLPLGANDWTTLYATFDRDTNAGLAAGNVYAAGSDTAIVAGGVVGSALEPKGRLANVVYAGKGNVPGAAGTLRVFLKGAPGANLFNDGKEYWIAVAERQTHLLSGPEAEMRKQPGAHLLLYKSAENNIVFGLNNDAGLMVRQSDGMLPPHPMPVSLKVSSSALNPQKWHEVVISWNIPRRKYWLRVNDQLVEGTLPESITPGSFHYLILSTHPNIYTSRQSHFPGLMDELLISDRPLDRWLQADAPKAANRAEAPAPQWARSPAKLFTEEPLATYESQLRTYLDTQARFRNAAGGWNFSIHYPSGMQFLSNTVRNPYPDNVYNNAKDNSSTLAAVRYALAYEALGDEAYLEVAKQAAATVMSAQQPEGWWPYNWTVTPQGILPYLNNRTKAPIEDHTQTGPIFLLLYLHRVTGDEKYSQAAQKGLDFLIQAQNPAGSWSHSYNLEKKRGESTLNAMPHAGEFNDHTTTGPMAAMMLGYRLTGQQRFLDSYLRATEWVLAAFIDRSATGGAIGWAQQYNEKNEPIAARHFEPPALENNASAMAATEMLNAYRLTGDTKYLEPARKWVQWLSAKGTAYSFYHDIETGRPIASEDRKIYFLDDPEQVAAHKAAVERTGRPYSTAGIAMKDWVNIATHVRDLGRIETDAALPLERAVPPRRLVEAQVKARTTTLAGWSPTFDWARGTWAVTSGGYSGPRLGVGSMRTVAPSWVIIRERALRGDVPLDHPLLRMPYDISPVTVVAPQLNLYARLPAKNDETK